MRPEAIAGVYFDSLKMCVCERLMVCVQLKVPTIEGGTGGTS